MATKNQNMQDRQPERVTGGIDIGKLGQGLTEVSHGYSLIFEALAENAGIFTPTHISDIAEGSGKTAAVEVAVEPAAAGPAVKTASAKQVSEEKPEETDQVTEESQPASSAITKAEFLSEVQGMVRKSTAMQKKVKELMDAYGIKSLSTTPPEQYEAFLKDARDLSRKS